MNHQPAVILSLLALGLGSAFAAQSGHHALAQRHLEARGGSAALQGLKVIERNGSLTVHGATPEIKGTYHTCVQYPDRVAVDVNAGPVQVHQVLGDFGALECDATFTACSPAQESVAEELRKTARVANREELDESIPEGVTVEPILQATTEVGYRYRKDDRIVEEEFSPETGLLRRRRNGERERLYGDWRSIGGKGGMRGVLLPMRIEDFQDGKRTVTTTLTSATHTDSPSEWCLKRFSTRPRPRPPLPPRGPWPRCVPARRRRRCRCCRRTGGRRPSPASTPPHSDRRAGGLCSGRGGRSQAVLRDERGGLARLRHRRAIPRGDEQGGRRAGAVSWQRRDAAVSWLALATSRFYTDARLRRTSRTQGSADFRGSRKPIRLSRIDWRLARIGLRLSRIGWRLSRIGWRLSGIGLRHSRIGLRLTRIGLRLTRIG